MSEPVREWRFYLDDMIGYLGIDNDTVWSIIQDELPVLLQRLEAMRAVSHHHQGVA